MTNSTPQEEWQPPADVKPWMVCAACKHGDVIFLGARHWDNVMWQQAGPYFDREGSTAHLFDQGFIDQWGRFYQRDEAMEAVKASGQPFNAERQGGITHELYSEGPN